MALIDNTGSFGINLDDSTSIYSIVELDPNNPGVPLDGGISQVITVLTNGVDEPVSFGGGIEILEVEANIDSGYTLVLLTPEGVYLTWQVADDGKYISTDFTPDIAALEVEWNQDINGDTFTGPAPVITPVDSEGDAFVQTSDGVYQLVPVAGDGTLGTPVTLTNGASTITDTFYPGWAVVEAEPSGDAGGYKVVFYNAGTDSYIAWNVTSTGAKDGSTLSNQDYIALEIELGVDINGDDIIETGSGTTVLPVDSEGDAFVQTSDGVYQLVPVAGDGTLGTPVTLTNGASTITDTFYPGWAVVEAEPSGDAGGYKVVFYNAGTDSYIAWNVTSTGAKDGSTLSNQDYIALEIELGVDINGDDIIETGSGTTVLPVDSEGDAFVQTSDGVYQLVPVAGDGTLGTPVTLTNGASTITDTFYPGWAVVEAEPSGDAGGYKVVFYNAGTDSYIAWNVTSTGAKDGSTLSNQDYIALEIELGVDINGDDIIETGSGTTVLPVDSEGDAFVQTSDGVYQLVPVAGDGTLGTPVTLTNGASTITDTFYPGWAVVEAEPSGDAGGYKVVFYNAGTDSYIAWNVTSTGAKDGSTLSNQDYIALEIELGVDINGDDIIETGSGTTVLPVDSEGDAFVQTSDGVYQLVPVAGDGTLGTPVTLTNGASTITDTFYPGWAVVEAEPSGDAGGYKVVFYNAGTDSYIAWNVTSTGAKDGSTLSNQDYIALEIELGVDINGDDIIETGSGTTVLPVNSEGDAFVQTSDGVYQLVPVAGDGTLGTPVTLTNGASTITDTFYPGWAVVEAEPSGDAGGYKVVFYNAGTDSYIAWNVTSTGAKDGSTLTNQDYIALEIELGVDIDGDDFVFIEDDGATTTTLESSTVDGQYFVNGTVGLTDGPSDPTTVDEVVIVHAEQFDGDTFFTLLYEVADGYQTNTASLAGVVDASSPEIYTLSEAEALFQVDLDGNGIIPDIIV